MLKRIINQGRCIDCGVRIAVYDDGSRDLCDCIRQQEATPAERKAMKDWRASNPYPDLHSRPKS